MFLLLGLGALAGGAYYLFRTPPLSPEEQAKADLKKVAEDAAAKAYKDVGGGG